MFRVRTVKWKKSLVRDKSHKVFPDILNDASMKWYTILFPRYTIFLHATLSAKCNSLYVCNMQEL
jgi:hypothetical protein